MKASIGLPAALLLLILMAAAAAAGNVRAATRGVALVVGNSAYEPPSQLKNSVKDALDMTNLLRRAGFDVISLTNASNDAMRRSMIDFERKLRINGGVGLFYFSGHGAQSRDGHRNMLLPTGVRYQDMSDIDVHGIDAALVLVQMKRAGGMLNVLILDACRDNSPLPDRIKKSLGGQKGLARMEAPSGSMIAFAASPGGFAYDNDQGGNSRYTGHLLASMATPGLGLSEIFQDVQGKVEDETNGKQSPELLNKLISSKPFYFFEQVPRPTNVKPFYTKPLASNPETGKLEEVMPLGSQPVLNVGRYADSSGCLRESDGSFVVGFRSDCK